MMLPALEGVGLNTFTDEEREALRGFLTWPKVTQLAGRGVAGDWVQDHLTQRPAFFLLFCWLCS